MGVQLSAVILASFDFLPDFVLDRLHVGVNFFLPFNVGYFLPFNLVQSGYRPLGLPFKLDYLVLLLVSTPVTYLPLLTTVLALLERFASYTVSSMFTKVLFNLAMLFLLTLAFELLVFGRWCAFYVLVGAECFYL